MGYYKILKSNTYKKDEYSIVPIRMDDRFLIMQWRNEQLYHLRQNKPLTIEDQERYFNEVVVKLYDQEKPNQILFSYLENDTCIGYGGLVHINWIDKNSEISFILDTSKEEAGFHKHWSIYLGLIEEVAFNDLALHKIYTYAFDLRPHLYEVLEQNAYNREAVLKEHCLYEERFKDVIIHSKISHVKKVNFRLATAKDARLLFDWANDKTTRGYSLNQEPILWEKHLEWFNSKLSSADSVITVFELDRIPIGQVRLDRDGEYWVIDYSVESKYRGMGLGKLILESILNQYPKIRMMGYVKRENAASIRVFESLGFKRNDVVKIANEELIKFTR